MELRPYVERLHSDLVNVAAAGGSEVATAAERLLLALEPSVRMVLLDAVAAAAAEITSELDGEVVDVRLRGRDLDFVVTPAAWDPLTRPPSDRGDQHARSSAEADDRFDELEDAVARLTVRLSERLKTSAESAASAAGRSLNSWIADAVRAAVSSPGEETGPRASSSGRSRRGARRVQGWAR